MSTQALGGATSAAATSAAGTIAPGALAAGERVARLQTLAAELREGPASFSAALRQASSGQQATASASATSQSPASALPASSMYPATAALPQTSLGASTPSGTSSAAPAEASAGGEAGAQYAPLVEAAAQRNGIDPAVLHGLIQQESGFDPNSRSGAGAVGLTQLMPSTAASLGVSEPLDPAQSIEGGARYLGEMLQRFGGNVEDALAAYNAGPGAVERYGGVPPYAETQQYVGKVLGYAAEYAHGASATGSAPAPVSVAGTSGVAAGGTSGVAVGGTSPATGGAIA